MPQISEKGMAMPSSPIRKLVPFADKAKERGIKVYHLNIGQPDIQTPDVALQALKTCNEKSDRIHSLCRKYLLQKKTSQILPEHRYQYR